MKKVVLRSEINTLLISGSMMIVLTVAIFDIVSAFKGLQILSQ